MRALSKRCGWPQALKRDIVLAVCVLAMTGGLGVRWRATDSLSYSSSVSSQMVKGPSFISDTSIIAANLPVSTRGTSLRAWETNSS